MPWFLYLIECEDDSVYTGIATDVQARFDKHVNGTGARYTRSRKPRQLLAWFELADRSSASRAEYWVKRLPPVEKRALAAGVRSLESVLPAPPADEEEEEESEPDSEIASAETDASRA
ncbi:GIY-YIG nuclease family protein [Paraburkholderia sp. GAS448]|uniref:GIY-YIG nuclease family protein n=1 Tax=Paraburkholderia sp. GAS448 TaxID=3035136 RepID=UPI003D209DF6